MRETKIETVGKRNVWFWGTVASAFASVVFLAISTVLLVQTDATKTQVEIVYSNIEKAVTLNAAKNEAQDERFDVLDRQITANTANISNLTKNVDLLTDRVERLSVKQ